VLGSLEQYPQHNKLLTRIKNSSITNDGVFKVLSEQQVEQLQLQYQLQEEL